MPPEPMGARISYGPSLVPVAKAIESERFYLSMANSKVGVKSGG